LAEAKFLLDINLLVALADPDHQHHPHVLKWFTKTGSSDWGTCAFTDAGFLRIMTSPKIGALAVAEATEMLAHFTSHPGYRAWPINLPWATLSAPFQKRLFGHQQVTDAYLLGLAIHRKGILVSLDKGLRYLAGNQFAANLLVIE